MEARQTSALTNIQYWQTEKGNIAILRKVFISHTLASEILRINRIIIIIIIIIFIFTHLVFLLRIIIKHQARLVSFVLRCQQT